MTVQRTITDMRGRSVTVRVPKTVTLQGAAPAPVVQTETVAPLTVERPVTSVIRAVTVTAPTKIITSQVRPPAETVTQTAPTATQAARTVTNTATVITPPPSPNLREP